MISLGVTKRLVFDCFSHPVRREGADDVRDGVCVE